VHVSTDYVFDGTATTPYDEWAAVTPLSEYGRSKLAGERELAEHAASWAVVRTSWVFGERGGDLVSWAFAKFDDGELDGVLADQVSVPTYAPDLAGLLARFAVQRRQGLFHATSGTEATTRHELITVALRERGADADAVAPIATADFHRPAARPPYSALDNRALRLAGDPPLRAWRDAVTEYVKAWDDEPGGEGSES
jgi:dTDP-4-dehydrorhamnose reductase